MPPLSKDLFPKLNIPETVYGSPVRNPYESELNYFYVNPQVAGMAAEDGAIILNPYSSRTPDEFFGVAQNEGIRQYLKKNKIEPNFKLTKEQENYYKKIGYPQEGIMGTHISRILTGDPSLGEITPEQQNYADWLKTQLPKLEQPKK